MPRVSTLNAAHRTRAVLWDAPLRWLGPRVHEPSIARSLGVAASTVAVGVLMRWLIDPVLTGQVAYTVYIASVAVSTRRGGLFGGIAATLLSLLAGTIFFAEPRGLAWPMDKSVLVTAPLFLLTAAIVIAALELETRARRQVEERDALLQGEYQRRMRLERDLEQARRLDSLGQLAGGVAHEFNNLLAAVIGSTELLLRKDPENRLLLGIASAARSGTEITRQLLSLGRRQMFELKPLCINDVVEECLKLASQLVPEDIRLVPRLTPKPWPIDADPTGVQQILLNLVTNARDALPQGGSIYIETENVTLDSRFVMEHPELSPGDYVLLRVGDSGAGMNEETMRHIFEPFFTTKREGKGTGLGLSVTYGAAKQLHGHILVSSKVGEGSVFCVYLPRAKASTRSSAPASEPQVVQHGEPLKVLLVEDNELVRGVVANMLQSLGHEACVAENGEVALELAAQRPDLDVLLTDVVMPQLNGPQLAERLGGSRPDLAVVFMSGYAEKVVLQKGRLGDGLLLKKPFSAAQLEGCLRNAVRRPARRATDRAS